MGNTVKEYSQMIGFLTRDKTSTVPRSMDQEPRNIKLAKYIPRHEMDNMNTKDLEQTPDSVLRPGETLEDFDVTFRRPNADGGVQQLVQNTVDGSRPGYKGPRQPSSQKRTTMFRKLYPILPDGYVEDYKRLFLTANEEGTFSHKPGDAIKSGKAFMKEKYGDFVKKMKTRLGPVENMDRKLGHMNSSVIDNLNQNNKIVPRLSKTDVKRKADLEIVGKWSPKAPKGKVTHHFMPLAGVEGESLNLTSTKNTAYIDSKLNERMSHYDKRLKANQKEQIKLLKEKSKGWEKKIKDLNIRSRGLVTNSRKKVPGSAGYLGYSEITVKPDGTYTVEVRGIDYNKTIAGLKGEEILYKNISNADKIKVQKIADLTAELGGKEKLQKLLFEGGGTKVERGLVQRIVSGGGKFAISMLNPRELIKLKNLVGPGALGLMAAYEVGSITDDVLRLNKPLDEALAGNWVTKSFLPYSEEFAKQKNLLQSGNLTGSQKEYALEMMKIEKAIKEDKRISMMESTQLVDGAFDDNFIINPQEKIDAAKKKFTEQVNRIKESSFVEGSGRQLENKALMDDYEDAQKARTGASTIFGGPQSLVNKAPRPKNMGRGPMTEKGKMKLDFSIPGYTPYDKAYTPSNDEILNHYKQQEYVHPRFGTLQPGEGTRIRMGMASKNNRGIYGAGQKMATGGLAGLMKKYYD